MSGEMLERLTLIMNNFFLLPENAHSEKAVIALLKAIREPTDDMKNAAEGAWKNLPDPCWLDERNYAVWQAMIDEILGEGK